MIIPIERRGIVACRGVKEQAVNNQLVAKGASIEIDVPKDKVLFLIKAYGAAITQITEENLTGTPIATGLTPVGDIAFPFLRFDRTIVITGGASTNVVYIIANCT